MLSLSLAMLRAIALLSVITIVSASMYSDGGPPSDEAICQYKKKTKTDTNDIDRQVPFCSFFDNRAPRRNSDLRNCSWFSDCSCCQQTEIDHLFSALRPLPGANRECLAYLNMLICYICAPNQFRFYSRERLTVCASFCSDLYRACLDAVLKGSPIKTLYRDGISFCQSRGFSVSNGTSDCYQGVLSNKNYELQAKYLVEEVARRSDAVSQIASTWFVTLLAIFTSAFLGLGY